MTVHTISRQVKVHVLLIFILPPWRLLMHIALLLLLCLDLLFNQSYHRSLYLLRQSQWTMKRLSYFTMCETYLSISLRFFFFHILKSKIFIMLSILYFIYFHLLNVNNNQERWQKQSASINVRRVSHPKRPVEYRLVKFDWICYFESLQVVFGTVTCPIHIWKPFC